MPLQLKQLLPAPRDDVSLAIHLPPAGFLDSCATCTALHSLDHDRLPVWEPLSWDHKQPAGGRWNELPPRIVVNCAPRMLPPRSISHVALRNVNAQLQGRVADLEAVVLMAVIIFSMATAVNLIIIYNIKLS